MNSRIVLLIALMLALFLDGTFLSLPLVFALCILLYVIEPKSATIVLIFFTGIVIDMLRLTTVGSTSLFLLCSCALIYIYRNTFEFKDTRVITLLPFIFAYIYANIFGYNTNILIYLVFLIIAEGAVYYFGKNSK